MQVGHVLKHHRIVARRTEVGLDQFDQAAIVGAIDASMSDLGMIDVEEHVVGGGSGVGGGGRAGGTGAGTERWGHARIMHKGCYVVPRTRAEIQAAGVSSTV